MESYDYPYAEFTRDFDAVIVPLNAAPPDDMQQSMRVRQYIQRIYPDKIDRVERGSALMMCLSYINRHAAAFDVGKVAVRGGGYSFISEGLLRAVHNLVCSATLSANKMPKPAAVMKLAEKYNDDDRNSAPHATPPLRPI